MYDARQVVGHRTDHGPDPVVARGAARPRRRAGRAARGRRAARAGARSRCWPARSPSARRRLGCRSPGRRRSGPGRGRCCGPAPRTRSSAYAERRVPMPRRWWAGVDPDPDAGDLEVVAQARGDHQLAEHQRRPRTRRTPRRARRPCRRRGASSRRPRGSRARRPGPRPARPRRTRSWKASMSASSRGSTGRITSSLTRATVSRAAAVARKRIVGVSGLGSNTCSG